MTFYRRKIVIISLTIIFSFFAWLIYLWAVDNYRPSQNQTKLLTEISNKIHAIMLQKNLDWVQIKDGLVWPESLEGEDFETIKADIRSADKKINEAKFIYQCQDKCYFTAYFYIDGQEDEFVDGTSRYYQYNPDGYLKRIIPGYPQSEFTEHLQYNQYAMVEEFVPSISEAVNANPDGNRHLYLFCEPLEQKQWHYCKGYQSS